MANSIRFTSSTQKPWDSTSSSVCPFSWLLHMVKLNKIKKFIKFGSVKEKGHKTWILKSPRIKMQSYCGIMTDLYIKPEVNLGGQ